MKSYHLPASEVPQLPISSLQTDESSDLWSEGDEFSSSEVQHDCDDDSIIAGPQYSPLSMCSMSDSDCHSPKSADEVEGHHSLHAQDTRVCQLVDQGILSVRCRNDCYVRC